MPSTSSSTTTEEQAFLHELDKKLWNAADRLRANLDAAVYSREERDSLPQAARRVDAESSSNHAVLGLVFLKYVSDSFAVRQKEIEAQLCALQGESYPAAANYASATKDVSKAFRIAHSAFTIAIGASHQTEQTAA